MSQPCRPRPERHKPPGVDGEIRVPAVLLPIRRPKELEFSERARLYYHPAAQVGRGCGTRQYVSRKPDSYGQDVGGLDLVARTDIIHWDQRKNL